MKTIEKFEVTSIRLAFAHVNLHVAYSYMYMYMYIYMHIYMYISTYMYILPPRCALRGGI